MRSVYIHIPFCNNICSYCDFPKLYYNKLWVNRYLDALELEIKSIYNNELIETIYIGGGTPSSLDIDELKRLFKIISMIDKSKLVEFTIECNLDSLSIEKIDLFKANNINRISIGIETFNTGYLKLLNRKICNLELIDYIKNIGITNINVDLIYAIPGETIEELIVDINKILELDVPHISTYSLIVEPNTVLYNKKTESIDEDIDFSMYETIYNKLNNYAHYEVSNFAKAGYESKHNLNYWNNEHYYGFGMGASGYIDNIRYTNTKSITKYIDGTCIYEKEILTQKEEMENEMILGLRKTKGVSIDKFKDKFNIDIENKFNIKKIIEEGKLIKENGYLRISEKYFYLSNEILINFIGD